MLVSQPKTQHTSPRMTQNKYPFSFEAMAKIVHHLERVLFHLRNIHCSALYFFTIRRVGFSSSPLVPLHDGEIFLPRAIERACERNESDARTTVDEQKNRVVHVLAAHFDPLINPADS